MKKWLGVSPGRIETNVEDIEPLRKLTILSIRKKSPQIEFPEGPRGGIIETQDTRWMEENNEKTLVDELAARSEQN